MVALAGNEVELSPETQDPVRTPEQSRTERAVRRGQVQETGVNAPALPRVAREQAQAEAAPTGSELFPENDPRVTQEPIVLKPKNRAFGNEGQLVVDPSKSRTSQDLYETMKAAEAAGVKTEYVLGENKKGLVTLTLGDRKIEVNIRYDANWEQRLQEGYNALARDPAPALQKGVDGTPAKTDLSRMPRDQLVEFIRNLYPEAEAAQFKREALEYLESSLRAIPPGAQYDNHRGDVVSTWANQAAQATTNRQQQLNQSVLNSLNHLINDTGSAQQQAASAQSNLAAMEGGLTVATQQALTVRDQFDRQLEAVLGLTHLNKTATDVMQLEIRGTIKQRVQDYRTFDIEGGVTRARQAAYNNALKAGQTQENIMDLQEQQVLLQAEQMAGQGAFAAPELFKSRQALEKYAEVLIKRRDQATDRVEKLKDSLGANIDGAMAEKLDSTLSTIDTSICNETVVTTEQRTRFGEYGALRADAKQRMTLAVAQFEEIRGGQIFLQGEVAKRQNVAGQEFNNLVMAIQQTLTYQAWVEIDRGLKDGSRQIGGEIGDIIREKTRGIIRR